MCSKERKEDSIVNLAQEPGQIRTPFRWRGAKESRPRFSLERARRLVCTILENGEDEAARALIQLLAGIAYEPDAL